MTEEQQRNDQNQIERAMGVIYKITSPSGKAYIGQTVQDVNTRFNFHCFNGSKCPGIKKAIQKYGKDAMKLEVLKTVPDDELSFWEIKMIKDHNTFGRNGYNMTPGGDMPPLKCPEVVEKLKATLAKPSVKAKMSAAQKRNHARPGEKEKRSIALKKAHAKPETAARFREAQKKAQNREDVKEKQRVAQIKAHKDPRIHKARMAGLEASRKDPVKEAARIEAIRAAHRRDPTINKRRGATLKATLAAKKKARLEMQRT